MDVSLSELWELVMDNFKNYFPTYSLIILALASVQFKCSRIQVAAVGTPVSMRVMDSCFN